MHLHLPCSFLMGFVCLGYTYLGFTYQLGSIQLSSRVYAIDPGMCTSEQLSPQEDKTSFCIDYPPLYLPPR